MLVCYNLIKDRKQASDKASYENNSGKQILARKELMIMYKILRKSVNSKFTGGVINTFVCFYYKYKEGV